MPDTDSEIREFAKQVKAMREVQKHSDRAGTWNVHEKALKAGVEVDATCERILSSQKVFPS